MDKPISLSVKDYLIRVLAPKMMMGEKVIEAVVNHQFQSANEALLHNKSVEISGFAKFIFNQKKADKRMEFLLQKRDYYQEALVKHPNSTSWKNKLHTTLISIESLKSKIDGKDFSNLRGLEEQDVPSQGNESLD